MPENLINFTPALHEEALKLISRYKTGPIFTPPSVATLEGTLGTIISPGSQGGTNWPGGSYDPETRTVYVYAKTEIAVLGMVPGGSASDMAWVQGRPGAAPRAGGAMGAAPAGGGRGGRGGGAAAGGGEGGGPGLTVQGLPLLKPPYGSITAIDLEKGEFRWQIAHGETPDNIKNHPALKGLNIPRTGRPGNLGPLTTKSLVICGEAGFFTTPAGRGAMLRAYDKMTGQEVGAVYMNAPQSGSPMTYMQNGEQYIVVAISGAGYSGELLAFRLPKQ